jgi:hypothetical protein
MRIHSNGFVGIGTAAPARRLHLHDDSSDANYLVVTNSTTGTSSSDGVLFGVNSAEEAIIWNFESTSLKFATAGVERMRIDSSGKILKGLTTGRAQFFHSVVNPVVQIEGNGDFDRQMSITSSSSTSNFGAVLILGRQRSGTIGGNTIVQAGDSVGLLTFQANDGTNFIEGARISANIESGVGGNDMPAYLSFFTNPGNTSLLERMRIDSSGRVGIGTASPASPIHSHLASSDANRIRVTNSTTGATASDGFIVGLTSAEEGIVWNYENSDMLFGTNNTERMRIDSSGNVGLGVTSISDARFKIKGANNNTTAFNDGVMVTSNNTSVYKKYSWMGIETQGGMHFSEVTNAVGETMRITSTGNVGIGGTAPNYQLHVVSSIGVGSHGFAQQLSISNQRIQSLLLGTGYRTLMINGLGGDIVMGSGSTQRLAFGTNDGVKYSGFGPAHGAAQDVGLNFYTTTNAGTTFVNHFRIDHNGDKWC